MSKRNKLKIENLESELLAEELGKISGGFGKMTPYSNGMEDSGASMIDCFPAPGVGEECPSFPGDDFGDKLRSTIEQSFPWQPSRPEYEWYSSNFR